MIQSTYAETTIPVREPTPDYPDSFRGKRLLGVDAYHNGHYWCGDRVEVFERRELLDATDGDAAVDVQFRKLGATPVAELEGAESAETTRNEAQVRSDGGEPTGASVDRTSTDGLAEYLTNVGAHVDRHVDDAEPVYADDAGKWERVSSYARDLIVSRTRTASPAGADSPGSAGATRNYGARARR